MTLKFCDIERKFQLLDMNYSQNVYINKPIYKLFNEPYGIHLSKEGIEYLKNYHPEIFQIKKLQDLIYYIWNMEIDTIPKNNTDSQFYFTLNDVFLWVQYIYAKYPSIDFFYEQLCPYPSFS